MLWARWSHAISISLTGVNVDFERLCGVGAIDTTHRHTINFMSNRYRRVCVCAVEKGPSCVSVCVRVHLEQLRV